MPPTANSVPELRGFQRLWRALKQLFFEVLAALFAILAFIWLNAAFRSWTRQARWLIVTAISIAIIFVIFAGTTYRKSRKL